MMTLGMGALALLACVSETPDPGALVGMKFDQLENEYSLRQAKVWWTPETPVNGEQEITYFLTKGDLCLRVGHAQMVTAAQFRPRTSAPDTRLRQAQDTWRNRVKQKMREQI